MSPLPSTITSRLELPNVSLPLVLLEMSPRSRPRRPCWSRGCCWQAPPGCSRSSPSWRPWPDRCPSPRWGTGSAPDAGRGGLAHVGRPRGLGETVALVQDDSTVGVDAAHEGSFAPPQRYFRRRRGEHAHRRGISNVEPAHARAARRPTPRPRRPGMARPSLPEDPPDDPGRRRAHAHGPTTHAHHMVARRRRTEVRLRSDQDSQSGWITHRERRMPSSKLEASR